MAGEGGEGGKEAGEEKWVLSGEWALTEGEGEGGMKTVAAAVQT